MFPIFCLRRPEAIKFGSFVFYILRGNRSFSGANKPRNSNVSKILPVTTFRTINLGGKKNSSPLFSTFCEEQRVFFEGPTRSYSVRRADLDGGQEWDGGQGWEGHGFSPAIRTPRGFGFSR